ncbi:type IX secretion system membrane protein PorP/SprF [Cytophagaceae bacterium DM2B3-1]|uniref:Type IX secretion system membrane protein PorP/SprF n=1 Tax=Xanthocytophaga flava TaxID=3048013 RepID=A0ABT7CLR5_9BACT|nr:type IX secretion system membrane protein PorP/SprF [Xanthocytophaga flavus]MDJ1494481.1 type IX secretion system membrane protein PorP/SprF [Xanthocytophaga flavus]
MRKKILLFLFFCGGMISSFAQQDAQYSQYMFNMMAVNPAYAGSRDVLSITGLYRNQWVGMEGAPVTQTLTADMPIRKEKIGIGLSLFNDNIGLTATRGISGVYSYRIRFNKKGTLAFGIQGGVLYFNGEYSKMVLNPNHTPDPTVPNDYVRYAPVVGAGVYYSTDRFYLGASLPNLVKYTLTDQRIITSADPNERAMKFRHVFLMTGYVVQLSPSVVWKPSVLAKFVKGAPLQFDLNTNFWFYDRFAVGASYRTGTAILGMVEFQITPQLRLGYAYDYGLNALQRYNAGTHEIMLRYEFSFDKAKVLSPRYF